MSRFGSSPISSSSRSWRKCPPAPAALALRCPTFRHGRRATTATGWEYSASCKCSIATAFAPPADEFREMICRQFDVLYREGAQSGRVMAIALHPYLTGVPHRIDALDAALGYICNHARVWKATGAEIARHYRAQIAKQ